MDQSTRDGDRPGADPSAPRWIVHLPTTLTSLAGAAALAEALRGSLGHVTVIDFGETTLSEEDRQFLRTRIWCDHRLPGGGRCARRAEHAGTCSIGQDASDVPPDPARQAPETLRRPGR
ncbi:hypothetical protein [Micromonospora deserti]|uniref:hypothetical protein n=1 Tax=Micromonospora deserti TaxID=2070366 RepID=UPI001F15E92E|nr:hypothetical protein [Micromonospora deserti]